MTTELTQLPPGFRFHPTDEELVMHYLCRRCASQPIAVPIIAEIDLYKFDPWDLPGNSLEKFEFYFKFSLILILTAELSSGSILQNWPCTERKSGISSLQGNGNIQTVPGRTGQPVRVIGRQLEPISQSDIRNRLESRRRWFSTPEKLREETKPIGLCMSTGSPTWTGRLGIRTILR